MTLSELKKVCEVLATAGDSRAAATLVVLDDNDELRKNLATLHAESKKAFGQSVAAAVGPTVTETALRKQLADAMYLLSKIQGAMTLAKELFPPHGVLETTKVTQGNELFSGVLFGGKPVDDVEPRPLATVPAPRRMSEAENPIREAKLGTTPTEEQIAGVKAIAKEYGMDVGGPEAAAIYQTRKNHGLPPLVASAATPTDLPAGSYDKSPKMTADGGGNKD